jgi:hypothetical protein
MSDGTWTKVVAKTAQEVCRLFPLGEAARPLLCEGQAPRQLFDLLLEKGHVLDAVRLLACALPRREAVWWACLCARQAYGAGPPPPAAQALAAAERWAADPREEHRRAAGAAAEAAGLGTPAGCAAMAAFWSGGSLAPPNAPAVPPGEQLTGHGVAGAVLLAAVLTEPEKAPAKHRQFLALGGDVAAGKDRWKEPEGHRS